MAAPHRSGNWIFSTGRRSTTVSPDRASVYSFDLEGRPVSWYESRRLFKRSLASEVHVRERAGGKRRRFKVGLEEAGRLFERVLERVAAAPADAAHGELGRRLAVVRGWTAASLLEERARFDAAYRPVSILPPDQYLAVVLQATFGCSWNRCTFCSFYQDRSFSARTPEAFRDHALEVDGLLGRGVALRRRVFLADGNALILSNARLRPIFASAREIFPDRPVSGFVDLYSGEHKQTGEWAELRELGLDRVSIGLETGHDPLLQWMNKPGSAREASAFVGTLKRAGLRVSTILLCGAGGDRFAEAHVRDTLQTVSGLPLGRGDIVYLSPFVEAPGSTYAQRAAADGVHALDEAALERQYRHLGHALRKALPGTTVTRYDIREFIY